VDRRGSSLVPVDSPFASPAAIGRAGKTIGGAAPDGQGQPRETARRYAGRGDAGRRRDERGRPGDTPGVTVPPAPLPGGAARPGGSSPASTRRPLPVLGPAGDRIVLADFVAGLAALPAASLVRQVIFAEPGSQGDLARPALLLTALFGGMFWPLALRALDPAYPTLPRRPVRLLAAAAIWLVACSGVLYLADKTLASRLLVIVGALVCVGVSGLGGARVRGARHAGPVVEAPLPHLGASAEDALVRGEPVMLDLVRLSESLTRPIVVLSGSSLFLYPSVLAPTDRAIKRVADIVSSSLLIVLASIPMLLTALAVLLVEGRPVVYADQRAGLYGNPFRLRKFRTMRVGAHAERAALWDANSTKGPAFKLERDPRVTPLGRFLRRFSLDELPQLFDVLAGRMSLIGPRPAGLDEVERYEPQHRIRLTVRPGLTGLWQVRRRVDADFEQRMADDLDYIEHWSLLLDLKIAIRTVPVLFQGKGV
jgi:lipopolysaccharide/colanic/teichoic acid biosynthesis glycosyltransferase